MKLPAESASSLSSCTPFQAAILERNEVRLEPLSAAHLQGLARAASGDRQNYTLAAVPTPETTAAYIEQNLSRAAGKLYLPFVQMTPAGDIVGHTAFLNPRYMPDGKRMLAVEIGSSWLHPDAQGGPINAASKLLLLSWAFETWNVLRVDLKTDARNNRARAGIEALGARFEGTLRHWQPSAAASEKGKARDTTMYSICIEEWQETKPLILARISRKNKGTDPR